MKRIVKGAEPDALAGFCKAQPAATWEEMRNDNEHGGQQAYRDCRARTIADQYGLCAYCEDKIDSVGPHRRRVEHVHPKSDTSTAHNWHLDWQNMLATCDGGERDGCAATPLPANLSCDAHKNHLQNKGALSQDVEREMINPLQLPPFPLLFTFDENTGCLGVNPAACATASLDAALLERTIAILNLNCARLTRKRKLIADDIARKKEILRKKDASPQKCLPELAATCFSARWPKYFTTIRCCLGQYAEDYLHSVQYNG